MIIIGKLMSRGAAAVDTIFITWFAVSVYTTILTLTAIGVFYIVRKRRSSILKSQQPPRTPYSGLEFNVATPTDTAKNRRVSSSRRTGVAEFVTNESTTTLKNYYEEHNKSSGKYSAVKASRQHIGHLGKRIFEQQFEEVEAVDFITSLDNLSQRKINSTIQVNLTKARQCTDDKKRTHFENSFEVNTFTDLNRKFGADDLAVPVTEEMSCLIDVKYSAVESLNVYDDLYEIQGYLQCQRNVVGPTAFRDARDFSGYIKVALNFTHVANIIEESDMSITETIKNPDVNVSKSLISSNQKCHLNWHYDKENINELNVRKIIYNNCNDMSISTVFSIDDLGDISITKPFPAKLFSIPTINQEKTDVNIHLNKSNEQIVEGRTVNNGDLGDLSMTKPIPTILLSVHSEIINKCILSELPNKTSLQAMDYQNKNYWTILFEDDLGDISMTKPISVILPSVHSDVKDKSSLNGNLITSSNAYVECRIEKRKNILFDDGYLSMTIPIPSNLLSAHSEIIDRSNIIDNYLDMHKSCSSENKLINEKLRDICQDEEPNKETITEKRNTILFDDDLGDLSMNKLIPTELLAVSDNKGNNESSSKSSLDTVEDMTEKRRTIMFEDDLADLFITKPIPSKLISVDIDEKTDSNDICNKPSRPNPVTIFFDDGLGDLPITKPISSQLLVVHSDISALTELKNTNDQTLGLETCKHRSLVCNQVGISLKKPVPTKFLSVADSFMENAETNEIINENCPNFQTTVHDNDENADMSITMELDQTMESLNIGNTDDNLVNTSIIKSISAELITVHSEIMKQEYLDVDVIKRTDMTISRSHELFNQDLEYKNKMCSEFSQLQKKTQDVVVYQVTTNETAKEKIDGSDLQDDVSKQSDDLIVQSNTIVGRSFIPIKEVNSKTELHKPIQSDIKEALISKNTSVNSESGNSAVARTISNKSILLDLLDMSSSSMTSGLEHKCVSSLISSKKPSTQDMAKKKLEYDTSEIFNITRDTDSDTQSNEVKENNNNPVFYYVQTKSSIELPKAMPKTDSSILKYLPELDDTKEKINNNKITSSTTIENENSDKVSVEISTINSFDQNMEISRYRKSLSDTSLLSTDNTKQLLEMLSELTKEHMSFSNESQSPRSLTLKDQDTIQNKTEPKIISIAPNRQSIVMNREDMPNNISMAQATLQNFIDMADSDVEEPIAAVAISPPKKTVGVSHEVVKTLQFEDESSGEFTLNNEMPLKKTAFRETSYMNDGCKANVIPSYLKDVSDGIKALIRDLVKPMTDDIPFEAVALGKSLKKDTPTCSTQIQTNLYTSCQKDMNADMYSNSDSLRDAENVETTTQQAYFANNSPAESVSFISEVFARSDLVSRYLNEVSLRPKRPPISQYQRIPGKVLIFDVENPLNNVLLIPTEFTEGHKYCPGESQENPDCSTKSPSQCSALANDYEVANLSVGYNIQNLMQCQWGDKVAISENQSLSKPRFIDQSICVKVTEVKDIEVNTTIAMTKNKELLERHSSLTLVGSDLARSTFDLDKDSETDSCYGKINSTSQQSVTQKPFDKLQTLSNTPKSDISLKRSKINTCLIPERDHSKADSKKEIPSRETPRKKSPRKKTSPELELDPLSKTTLQLLAKYNHFKNLEELKSSSIIPDSLMRRLGLVSSFTSSENHMKTHDSSIEDDLDDLLYKVQYDLKGFNVVAKINMLPFMGSDVCEWTISGTDTWCFLLLHGRIKLCIRLVHRHHNATRTRVRADTPVRSVRVLETFRVKANHKNAVAISCVKFACGALQHYCTSCHRAADAPELLRNGASVARSAYRWGRAMYDAQKLLNFKLVDNELVLTVTNVPISCVWQVHMRLVLSDTPRPFPHAEEIVMNIDSTVVRYEKLDEQLAAIPKDWRHVPDTLWAIYMYLKNRTRESEELSLSSDSHQAEETSEN